MKPVFVINGPNLNMLGLREPDVYGHETLAGLEERCQRKAKTLGLDISCRQSNHEGEIVSWIQEARSAASGIILNAGAYTHTSVAIHDALRIAQLPLIEVHLSNIYKREPFRHHSFISKAATGIVAGLGPLGYELAITAMTRLLEAR